MRLTFQFAGLMVVCTALQAMPPQAESGGGTVSREAERRFMRQRDLPNVRDVARIKQRVGWQRLQRKAGKQSRDEPAVLKTASQEKVLVLLVEFAGTNTFTWTPGSSTWDPLGKCDNSEFDGVNLANSAASTFFAQKHGITAPTNFTYHGPLHNEIPRPVGSNHASAAAIWVPDFSPAYYSNVIFGAGIEFDYVRQDGSVVKEDFTGNSVRDYYEDMSGQGFTISGSILGWLQVTNSIWWYGADGLPGARSTAARPPDAGAIAGAGSYRTLVIDALNSAKAAYPGFDWASFDLDQDGEIDRLWIIHAGYGEEDNPTMLNATSYGEGGLWSHSSSIGRYEVVPGVFAGAYIMMPENAGIAVLAHEFGHNLGAMDLYTYGEGQTSAGFWTLMSDSWVGFPLGFLPEAMDPMHLDNWGWLDPMVVNDPARVHVARLGQASRFPAGSNLVRGVVIELPECSLPESLAVQPLGSWQWWGGKSLLASGAMTFRYPMYIPSSGATLTFQTAYETEAGYDFFYVEASTNFGMSWQQLAKWDGTSTGFPAYQARSFSLADYAGRDLIFRFRYTTDEYLLGAGVFVDDIQVEAGGTTLLDGAESETELWHYSEPWTRNAGRETYSHRFYLQWRNTTASGGYDRALGDPRFRFGPVNPGLLVWYEDDRYHDNRIGDHLVDPPSFGPKGRLLVVDAHPEPYFDPYWVARDVVTERGIVFSRGLMRDAPFSRWPSVDFGLEPPFAFESASFNGRAAVARFSDARGFYPGIENLAPGSWRTRQWDASVVMPSSVPYGVRGEGYVPGETLDRVIARRSFFGTNEMLAFTTNTIIGGLSLPGGAGNPGAVGGQYGWNAWIVHQADSFAEVVIWNSQIEGLDTDGDGAPDWQEVIAGTNPTNNTSLLHMMEARLNEDASVQLTWTSAGNRSYRLWRTTSLAGESWSIGATNLAATPPLNTFRDTNAPAGNGLFYRVEVE